MKVSPMQSRPMLTVHCVKEAYFRQLVKRQCTASQVGPPEICRRNVDHLQLTEHKVTEHSADDIEESPYNSPL